VFVRLNEVMLVLLLSRVMPLWGAFEIAQFEMVTVPEMFVSLIPSSVAPPAESVTMLLSIEKPVAVVAVMPLVPLV